MRFFAALALMAAVAISALPISEYVLSFPSLILKCALILIPRSTFPQTSHLDRMQGRLDRQMHFRTYRRYRWCWSSGRSSGRRHRRTHREQGSREAGAPSRRRGASPTCRSPRWNTSCEESCRWKAKRRSSPWRGASIDFGERASRRV